MKESKEQVSDVVSEEVEEVTEPQPKKRRVLTEKQKEALARGRAKKLELNVLKKEAKKQPSPPTPYVSSASEEEGVQEQKEIVRNHLCNGKAFRAFGVYYTHLSLLPYIYFQYSV